MDGAGDPPFDRVSGAAMSSAGTSGPSSGDRTGSGNGTPGGNGTPERAGTPGGNRPPGRGGSGEPDFGGSGSAAAGPGAGGAAPDRGGSGAPDGSGVGAAAVAAADAERVARRDDAVRAAVEQGLLTLEQPVVALLDVPGIRASAAALRAAFDTVTAPGTPVLHAFAVKAAPSCPSCGCWPTRASAPRWRARENWRSPARPGCPPTGPSSTPPPRPPPNCARHWRSASR